MVPVVVGSSPISHPFLPSAAAPAMPLVAPRQIPPQTAQAPERWVAFERAGELRFGRVVAASPKNLRLHNGERLTSERVWIDNLPPPAAALLARAKARAESLPTGAVWRAACGKAGALPRLAAAVFADGAGEERGEERQLATAFALLRESHYFYRRNGAFVPQPQEVAEKIAAARALRGAEQQQELALTQELAAGKTPAAIADNMEELLYAPNKTTAAYRALKRHAGGDKVEFARFFIAAGLLKDARAYWEGLFCREPAWAAAADDNAPCPPPPQLPAAKAQAFSIDDAGTVEVDDAFSVAEQPNGDWRIGVHIAAPALCESAAVLARARRRLVSVYFPDGKRPMLPPQCVARYSLSQDEARPALSLYSLYSPATGNWHAGETVLESLQLAAICDPEQADEGRLPPFAARAYAMLEEATAALPAAGGEARRERKNFKVEANPPRARARRQDGATRVVAALMRLVNGHWGRMLRERAAGGVFRENGASRVAPKNAAAAYAWLSSPLRRYADLANQRLLLATLANKTPPPQNWKKLAADFDKQLTLAKQHQRTAERHYALLAALAQKEPLAGAAAGRRLVLQDYPLVGVCPQAAALPAGAQAQARVVEADMLKQRLTLELA